MRQTCQMCILYSFWVTSRLNLGLTTLNLPNVREHTGEKNLKMQFPSLISSVMGRNILVLKFSLQNVSVWMLLMRVVCEAYQRGNGRRGRRRDE